MSAISELNLTGVRIIRTDSEIACPELDDSLLTAGADLVLLPGDISEAALCEAMQDVSLLLMCYTPITARVITSAPRLQGIVKYGVGIDAIDIPAATAQGIPVVNVPEYAEQTVAEGAFCLMLSLIKRIVPINGAMQTQGWVDPVPAWLGNDLCGRCVGLVGVGRIGRAFARMAGQGFGAKVLGHDPNVSEACMRDAGIEKVDELHALLAGADVVSLHTVLNESTRGLIGYAEFAAMARTPVFINVSRGALVNEAALIEALDTGQVRAAGLDVYVDEPLKLANHALASLFGRDNVLMLPHLTFYTQEAMQRLTADTLARCVEILTGQPVTVRSHDPRLQAQLGLVSARSAQPEV